MSPEDQMKVVRWWRRGFGGALALLFFLPVGMVSCGTESLNVSPATLSFAQIQDGLGTVYVHAQPALAMILVTAILALLMSGPQLVTISYAVTVVIAIPVITSLGSDLSGNSMAFSPGLGLYALVTAAVGLGVSLGVEWGALVRHRHLVEAALDQQRGSGPQGADGP